MDISDRLKKARKAKGYTQISFSEALKVPVGTYRNWEQGINMPDSETIIRIVELLETSSDYLFGRADNLSSKSISNNYSGKKKYLMDRIAKADDKKLDKFQKLMELIDDEENGHHE